MPPRSSPVAKMGRNSFLLLLGAEALHRDRHNEVGVDHAGERHPHRRDALDDLGVGRGREAKAAIFGVDDGAEQAELLDLLDHLVGIFVFVLKFEHIGFDVAFEKAIDAVEDQCLAFVGEGFRLGGRFVLGRTH